MNSTFRYILIGIGIIIAIITVWYFSSIVAYILISAVLALIGRPLVDILGKLHIRKIKIPKTMRALITLVLIWILVFLFFRLLIPLIVG